MLSIQLARMGLLVLLAFALGVHAAAVGHHRGLYAAPHGGAVARRHTGGQRTVIAKRDVSADLASQFPDPADLHLSTSTIAALDSSPVTVVSNATHALFSLNVSSTLTGSLGWVALGLGGTSMASTHQMVIAFPTSASAFAAQGGWAVSSRSASGHTEPQALSAASVPPPTVLGGGLSSAPSTLTFVVPFTRSSDPSQQGLDMVFAYSSSAVQFDGKDPDTAQIEQHDDGKFGSFVVDLSKQATVNGDGSLSGGSGAASGGSSYQTIIMWHAIVGAVAWMLIAPLAVLVGRLGRNWSNWMKTHRALQAGLTVTLTLTAVILAVIYVKQTGSSFTAGGHQILGFLILIGVLFQASLGQYAHAKLDRNRTKRPGRNVTHIFLGCTLLIAGWVQVYLGLELYNKVVPGGLPSQNNLYIVWAVFVVVPVVLYLLSCAFLVADRRSKQGMSWSMSAFGLGRDGGTVANSTRLADDANEKQQWPPYVADLARAEDDYENRGFLKRLFSRARRAGARGEGSGRQRGIIDETPRLGVPDGKISPFGYDVAGNLQAKTYGGGSNSDEGHKSWGNGVNGRSELDAFNSMALQRGYAMAVDADTQRSGTPIAQQYGYGVAQTSNYVADPAEARERSGGMRQMILNPGLQADPTAAYRQPENTGRRFSPVNPSPLGQGERVLYPGPTAYNYRPGHAAGQGSLGGGSDVSSHSAGSGGSRRPLVFQGNAYYNGAR